MENHKRNKDFFLIGICSCLQRWNTPAFDHGTFDTAPMIVHIDYFEYTTLKYKLYLIEM